MWQIAITLSFPFLLPMMKIQLFAFQQKLCLYHFYSFWYFPKEILELYCFTHGGNLLLIVQYIKIQKKSPNIFKNFIITKVSWMVTSDSALEEMVGNLAPWFPQISVDHETLLSQRPLQSRKAKKKAWPKVTEE